MCYRRILFSVGALLTLVAQISAATIVVDIHGGGDFTTIQAALNAAANGDTIEVWPGVYTENNLRFPKTTRPQTLCFAVATARPRPSSMGRRSRAGHFPDLRSCLLDRRRTDDRHGDRGVYHSTRGQGRRRQRQQLRRRSLYSQLQSHNSRQLAPQQLHELGRRRDLR